MRVRAACFIMVVVCCLGLQPAGVRAAGPPADRGKGEPIFMRWLDPADPQDQTIRDYWHRAQQDELSPPQLVDLGTMLFERGWPKDAVKVYRSALDKDPELYEAWFRIGLVKQREGEVDAARDAYKRCLKLLTGHGWCNFYLGLLEEQTSHPSRALYYYRRAYKFAPELADPAVNPEVLSSTLQLGALVRHQRQAEFTRVAPMSYLEPEEVAAVRHRFAEGGSAAAPPAVAAGRPAPNVEKAATPKPEPSPVPSPAPPPRPPVNRSAPTPRLPPPTPVPAPQAAGETSPWGMPDVPNVSREGHIR